MKNTTFIINSCIVNYILNSILTIRGHRYNVGLIILHLPLTQYAANFLFVVFQMMHVSMTHYFQSPGIPGQCYPVPA